MNDSENPLYLQEWVLDRKKEHDEIKKTINYLKTQNPTKTIERYKKALAFVNTVALADDCVDQWKFFVKYQITDVHNFSAKYAFKFVDAMWNQLSLEDFTQIVDEHIRDQGNGPVVWKSWYNNHTNITLKITLKKFFDRY